MQIAEFIFKSQDQTNIYACKWSPDVKTRGVILIVHGLGEHIKRYSHWAGLFKKERIGFAGVDLPGHGLHHLIDHLGPVIDYFINKAAVVGGDARFGLGRSAEIIGLVHIIKLYAEYVALLERAQQDAVLRDINEPLQYNEKPFL